MFITLMDHLNTFTNSFNSIAEVFCLLVQPRVFLISFFVYNKINCIKCFFSDRFLITLRITTLQLRVNVNL